MFPMGPDPGARRAIPPHGKVKTIMHSLATMTRPLVTALCLVVLSYFVPGPSAAASLDEIKKRGYMVVATEDNYPPFEFVQDGQPAGLDHDLFKLLKEYAPFQVRQDILP